MTLPFPPKLSLALTPTPLQPLDRLSAELGGPRLWVKRDDLTHCALTGNKLRKLEFVLARAQSEGYDTLITCGGLQSNHCRTTALLGAQLGFKTALVLRGDTGPMTDGNSLLDSLAGAQIRRFPPAQYRAELEHLLQQWAEEFRQAGHKPWIIPTGASDGLGIWGYIDASRELADDYRREGISPEWVVSATGSGGTLGGLAVGHQSYAPQTGVMGMAVCDDAETFRLKVRADRQAMVSDCGISLPEPFVEPLILDEYVGPGYARAGREVFATIVKLARLEGLVLDPVYTGKAFHGLIREIEKGRFDGCRDLVFVHTGGIFGLFPYGEQLLNEC